MVLAGSEITPRDIEEERGQRGGDARHDAETRRAKISDELRQSLPPLTEAKRVRAVARVLGKHCRVSW